MKMSLGEMRLAIHQTHDCDVYRCIESVEIKLTQYPRQKSVDVHLFEIKGNPTATECYAWGLLKGENRVAILAVLRSGEISTAEQAVRSCRID